MGVLLLIKENIPTVIVGLLVIIGVGLALRRVFKKGGCACGGDCSCHGSCSSSKMAEKLDEL